MKYVVIYERAERNYSAYAPDLPGCIATGATLAETEALMREAMAFHLEGLREAGDPAPEPSTRAGTIEVAEESAPLRAAEGEESARQAALRGE